MRWPPPPPPPPHVPEGADRPASEGIRNWEVFPLVTGADAADGSQLRLEERGVAEELDPSSLSAKKLSALPSPSSSRWLCAIPRSLSFT